MTKLKSLQRIRRSILTLNWKTEKSSRGKFSRFDLDSTDDLRNPTTTFHGSSTIGRAKTDWILWKKFTEEFLSQKQKKNLGFIFLFPELILTITETWGDQQFCGLTGLEIVDVNDADCLVKSSEVILQDLTNQTITKLSDSMTQL